MKIKALINFEHDRFNCKAGQIIEDEELEASPLFEDLDELISKRFISIVEDNRGVESLPNPPEPLQEESAPTEKKNPNLKKGKKK